MMNFVCHSGGCDGADMAWETVAKEYGIKTFGYSFPTHKCHSDNPVILTNKQLTEGWDEVLRASIPLKRHNVNSQAGYIKGLLARNWFQVKNSDAVFAIGFLKNNVVQGGTGWACQMAINHNKPVYIFDQMIEQWHSYNFDNDKYEQIEEPILTPNFAGIGTRDINDAGINAIIKILESSNKSVN